jgi:hypothetical protein
MRVTERELAIKTRQTSESSAFSSVLELVLGMEAIRNYGSMRSKQRHRKSLLFGCMRFPICRRFTKASRQTIL